MRTWSGSFRGRLPLEMYCVPVRIVGTNTLPGYWGLFTGEISGSSSTVRRSESLTSASSLKMNLSHKTKANA